MYKLKHYYLAVRDKSIEAGLFFAAVVTVAPRMVKGQSIDEGLEGGRDTIQGDADAGERLFSEGGIFETITNFLLFLVGAISVIMLIIGGFKYVVSGGDSSKVESAKNTIIYAIVGIVVAFLAWAAVDFVIDTLQGE